MRGFGRLWVGASILVVLLALTMAQRPSSPMARNANLRPQAALDPERPLAARAVPPSSETNLVANVASLPQRQEQEQEQDFENSPIEQFDAWVERFRGGGRGFTPAATAEGELLAGKRREWIAALIKSDPKRAIEAAVPMAVRSRLPASVTQHLEERVSGRGSFGVFVATDFEKGVSDVRREVLLDGKRYDAFVYGRRLGHTTRDNVLLHGVAVGSLLAVAEEPIRALEVGEPIPAGAESVLCPVSARPASTYSTPVFADVAGRIESFCGARHLSLYGEQLAGDEGGGSDGGEPPVAQEAWSQGPKTCLFMRAAFPDDPSEPITQDGAYALMDAVNQWYVENSYDTTSIIPTVTPLLMLPGTKAYYSEQGTGRLMTDARNAAREAGYDTDNFHWDIVRFTSVPGFNFGGLASVHGKGTWLQSSGLGVTVHELGHNYGLWHANSWAGINDSVIGPGTHTEYGNSFDTMGSTANTLLNQFNAAFKNQLDWLPEAFVETISADGTYRVYTFDVPNITPGRKYALKVKKNYDRNYWAEFRQKFTHRWFLNGVLLNWDPWNNGVTNSGSGTHLLDTTPGTPDGKTDGGVVIGRTFTDPAAGVHITPIARGNTSPENWIDVVVNLGSFPSNSPPVAAISADLTTVPINGSVNFIANASDPDGDALAYYWDFNDANFGPNAPNATKSWSAAGEYTVRCTVSDMKGGVFSQHIVITVGAATTFRISGRVTTDAGAPLEGVRVHNGLSGTSYRGTYTDSDGNYVLSRLASGNHNISAVKYGYTLTRDGWSIPVAVGPNATARDWVAAADPVVTIAATGPTASEAGLSPGQFTISRTGPTNVALTVRLNRSGSASVNVDYTNSPTISGSPLQVTIPIGAASLDVSVNPIADTLSEGPERVTLTLMEDVSYILGGLAEASVTIVDDEPAGIPRIIVSASSPSALADNLAPESGSDHGVFVFSRTNNTANEVTVFYSVSGTATAGVDYTGLPGVVVIPAGENLTAVPFIAIDDLDVESNETVIVTILANAAYSGAGDNTSIVIADDDPPAVTITAIDQTGRETGGNPGTFTITRQGSLAANLVVSYAVSGSATEGDDFTALPGSATIPAGRATANVTVTPLNDSLFEGEETIVLTLLSSPAYNVASPGSAFMTLIDDEYPSVTVRPSDATATEQGLGTGAFTFTRTGPQTNDLIVNFSVNGTAQNGIDFEAIGTSIAIPTGTNNAILLITPVDDAVDEANETVRLVLLPGTGYTVGTNTPQTVTIQDNDTGLPGLGFTFSSSSGAESSTTVRLSVSLSVASTSDVTANYAVTGGSATGGGVDFTLASGTLRIVAGELHQIITVTVANDTLIESNETIQVTLSNPINAVLDANTIHTYTILDDDRNGTVSVSAFDPTASESGPEGGAFRIGRSVATNGPVTVFFQVVGGASAPSDYADLGTSVTLPLGSNFVDLVVMPVDDSTDETNETVTLNLLTNANYRIGAETASVTIIDDDDSSSLPIVTVVASDPLASEPGSDTGVFTVTRAGDTASDLTVLFSVGGSATSGTDFSALGTNIVIPAGATETNFVLTPLDDLSFESNETVIVTLTVLPEYRVGANASAEVTIEDNEIGVSVAASGSSAEDGSSTGKFTIIRTGNTLSDLTVNFNLAGTATRTNDYDSFGLSAIIPAGTNVVVIPVVAVNDTLPEGTETVVLNLISGAGYTVTPPSIASVLIVDDEPSVSVTATDSSAFESGDGGLFTLTRTGSTNADLTVQILVSGTASNGVDYVAIGSNVVILAGASSATVAVTPIDDADIEGNESVQLTIQPDAAYAIKPPVSALVTITDDEINLVPVATITSPAAESVFLANSNVTLLLEASVSDDGKPNPPGAITNVWTRLSGPGSVVFSDPTALITTAQFSTNGIYVLRLTASDSELSGTDQLTVSVGVEQMLTNGLRAHWHFDERTNNIAFDFSGNNRNATISGAAWAVGRFGLALDYDGTDDTAAFSSPALTRLTLSAWVQSDSRGESTTPRVINMPGYNVRIRRDTGSTANAVALESQRSTTTGEWRTPGEVVSDGPWYHLVVSYDSSSTANQPTFWVNGVFQPTTTRTTPVGTQLANTGTGYIGNSAAGDRTWDGRIDEMRLYDRVLTSNEVALLTVGPATNVAPVPDAGPPQTIPLAGQLTLAGAVTDDGKPAPPGEVITEWIKLSGSGEVAFTNPNDLQDVCYFSEPGLYVLRLIADDGQVKTVADVSITVTGPTTIELVGTDLLASEFAPQEGTGSVALVRSGDLSYSVTALIEISGTASNGVDYTAVASEISLTANTTNSPILIQPVLDLLPEGAETVMLTLLESSTYISGSSTSATVTIADRPWDIWRLERFTSEEMSDPQMSGDQADPDTDGNRNLGEYAANLDPKVADSGQGLQGAVENDSYVVTIKRRKAPTDIAYDVEVSTDLDSWDSGPNYIEEILPAVDDGNGVTETARYRLTGTLLDAGYRFVRLKVTLLTSP